MAENKFKNTQVWHVPIRTQNAAGDNVPFPTGDVFTAESLSPDVMSATIGSLPSDSNVVTVDLKPLALTGSDVRFRIMDSSGLPAAEYAVDFTEDDAAVRLVADFTAGEFTDQPAPSPAPTPDQPSPPINPEPVTPTP